MPSRTYMVGLRIALKALQSYVGKYRTKIEENAGTGLYAVLELLLSIVDIALTIMEGASDPYGNFDGPVTDIPAENINQIRAAIAAFEEAHETID